MRIIWLIAITAGIWSIALRQYKFATYLHIFIMGAVTIITWMGGFFALVAFGVNSEAGSAHTGLGIAILVIVTLETIGGMITWTLQKYSVKPIINLAMNLFHMIFGWILFILVVI